jgi:hypothetical protein
MMVTLWTALLLAAGDEPAAPAAPKADVAQEKQRQEEVALLAPAKAKMLEVRVGDEMPIKAALHAEPLLRWSNPTAGSVYGEVFLWHVDGRPAAIASIFRWYHPFKDGTVEIVSLSPASVSAREGDRVLWDCRVPGVSFHAAGDVAAPASGRGGRLVQMRALARRFTAKLKDSRSGELVDRELRLLNQPIHRYEAVKQGVIDGALFALAEVTDPEVILMIEAFKDGDSPKWRYALARMNNHELEVRLDGQVVQSWPRVQSPWKDRKANYTLFSFNPALVKTETSKESPKGAQP